MTDKNYKKVEVGQKAGVRLYGHILMVEIYEIKNEKVFFRTINPKVGEPQRGIFNEIETQRYLTVQL
jgi:hypothetical protein